MRFIRSYQGGRLFPAALAHDWATFAKGYNGPGQVDHYSAEIGKAYSAAREVMG